MEPVCLLEHLRIVQQTRELQGAVRAFCCDDENKRAAIDTAELAYEENEWRTGCDGDDNRIRHCDAEIAALVLKDLEMSEHFPGHRDGLAEHVLDFIRDRVFGPGHTKPPLTLMQHVYSHSHSRARLAREVCSAAVRSLVAPRSCFGLLSLADSISLPSLHSLCTKTALSHFAAAVEEDASGFAALNLAQLLFLVSHDNLKVEKEGQVFASVTAWIQASAADRMRHLPRLLEHGVRLELMDRESLAEVDGHPLVVQDRQASGLVAKAYLNCCYGALMNWDCAPPRHRRPLAQAATPCQQSVASCSSPPPSPAGTCSSSPAEDREGVAAEGGGWEPAQSCAREAGAHKRMRDCLSPSSNETPALRRKMVAAASTACLQQTASKPTRLPSKRRLFD